MGLPLVAREFGDSPTDVAAISAKRHTIQSCGEVWQELADLDAGSLCVVCGWDKQFVLVEDVKFMDEDEIIVPSRIRLEFFERSPNIFGPSVYLSAFEAFLESFRRVGERELNVLEVSGFTVGRDKLPHAMIEGSSQVVDSVPENDGQVCYSGFVTFSADGAFTGLIICFNSVAERASFLDEIVRVDDVLLGPLDL